MATRIGERDKRIRCQFGYSPYGFGELDDSAYEEKIEQVKELKATGLSHTQIAKELGLVRSHVDIISHNLRKNAQTT